MLGRKFRIQKLSLAAVALAAVPALLATIPQVQSRAPATAPDQRDMAIQQAVEAITARAHGRIGVAAADLDGGGQVLINGDMPFPMASTAKIAVAGTFLTGVEQGRFRLDQSLPMMMPVAERRERGSSAPLRAGPVMSAQQLMELMITRSNNNATDGLITAVGGVSTVNAWLARNGIVGQHLDSTMATLVRDDGHVNPAKTIDTRTASTPRAMLALLSAIDRGTALSPQSRAVLLDTMTRTSTGKNRMRAGLPDGTVFAHKTGTLAGVTDDVGIIRLPDGRHLALAIFIAGPESHTSHAMMIADITRALYDGYAKADTAYARADGYVRGAPHGQPTQNRR
ncbi:serine hydrolase [Novosphingobium sp. Fuku2-ISO-50]|jgi:beta-lactamase class A|uniref:serine hydrolase n=1 Tax=Novosphingobium sp. Fuku2-ISO-50 TaxID=1739114 RepID=UPI00076C613A|nr:serine hydrolase [Novosphingobium sp. Fuku2-ISO-50]KUR77096.1 serine hydrolase [Novosphingobium sp. Fuku2-ISO-50]